MSLQFTVPQSCQNLLLKTYQNQKITKIFREHMIDRLYLDLAEEASDLKIYWKLLQACQAAAKELSPEERGE
jgi:predicted SAM-dependent methyltransferase